MHNREEEIDNFWITKRKNEKRYMNHYKWRLNRFNKIKSEYIGYKNPYIDTPIRSRVYESQEENVKSEIFFDKINGGSKKKEESKNNNEFKNNNKSRNNEFKNNNKSRNNEFKIADENRLSNASSINSTLENVIQMEENYDPIIEKNGLFVKGRTRFMDNDREEKIIKTRGRKRITNDKEEIIELEKKTTGITKDEEKMNEKIEGKEMVEEMREKKSSVILFDDDKENMNITNKSFNDDNILNLKEEKLTNLAHKFNITNENQEYHSLYDILKKYNNKESLELYKELFNNTLKICVELFKEESNKKE